MNARLRAGKIFEKNLKKNEKILVKCLTGFSGCGRIASTARQEGEVIERDREGKERGATRGGRRDRPGACAAGVYKQAAGHAFDRISPPLEGAEKIMESLILAQNERWRRVLSMQVERERAACRPRERRTGE